MANVSSSERWGPRGRALLVSILAVGLVGLEPLGDQPASASPMSCEFEDLRPDDLVPKPPSAELLIRSEPLGSTTELHALYACSTSNQLEIDLGPFIPVLVELLRDDDDTHRFKAAALLSTTPAGISALEPDLVDLVPDLAGWGTSLVALLERMGPAGAKWLQDLATTTGNEDVLRAALRAHARVRPSDAPDLFLELLEEGSAAERAIVVEMLTSRGEMDPRYVDALFTIVGDGRQPVELRAAVVEALGTIEAPAIATVAHLVDGLGEPGLRDAAVLALGRCGSDVAWALPLIERKVGSSRVSPGTRVAAVRALHVLGRPHPGEKQLLVAYVAHDSPEVRRMALAALVELRPEDPDTAATLSARFPREATEVQLDILTHLAALGSDAERILHEVAPYLELPDPVVVNQARSLIDHLLASGELALPDVEALRDEFEECRKKFTAHKVAFVGEGMDAATVRDVICEPASRRKVDGAVEWKYGSGVVVFEDGRVTETRQD